MKHLFTYVRCKKQPKSAVQVWVSQMSGIHSVCASCGQPTGIGKVAGGYSSHYDLFEVILRGTRGLSLDDLWDQADALIKANPDDYRVTQFTEYFEVNRPRIKRNKEAPNAHCP